MMIDSFTRGYVLAALWTSDDNPGSGQWQEHGDYTIANIAPVSLARAIADCAAFQDANADDLALADYGEGAGHDFWLTRNRHGAGFWDRGYGDVGQRLTTAAQAFGETDLYVGDDGRIYLS